MNAGTPATDADTVRGAPDAAGTRATQRVSERALWFGLLAGHVAWSIQLMAGYFLSHLACVTAGEPLRLGLHVLTLLALAVVAVAGVVSYRSWRRVEDTPVPVGEAAGATVVHRRERFMALAGVGLNALYAFVILLSEMANVVVGVCSHQVA